MLIIVTNVLQGEVVVEGRIWYRIWSYATSAWKNSKMDFQKTGKFKKKKKKVNFKSREALTLFRRIKGV